MEIILLAVLMLYLTDKFFDLKNLLNPFVFFYLYQTVFCFIALAYSDIYPVEISEKLKLYIVIAYILTFFGGLTSRHLFQRSGIHYIRYNDLILSRLPSRPFIVAGMLIFVLAILLFAYFTYKTGGIIVLGSEIENARIERRKGAGMINLMFISFFLYGFLIVLLNKRISFGIKSVLFIIAALALLSFGSRAPFIKLLLSSFLLMGVLNIRKYTFKKYAFIGIVIIGLIVLLGALRTNLKDGVDFLDLLVARMGWRPFVNIQNLQRIFEFFPAKHDFMYGYSYLVELKIFLPGHNPNFGTYLKDVMHWEFEGGSITPTFLYIHFYMASFLIQSTRHYATGLEFPTCQ